MVNLYLPTDKNKKTRTRGFWIGNEGLCYDYIKIHKTREKDLSAIQVEYNQEILFYTKGNHAFLYSRNTKTKLCNVKRFYRPIGKDGLKDYLKDLLREYEGFTVYIEAKNYLFEVWR